MTSTPGMRAWGFLTSHSLALLRISQSPDITLRTLARDIGITERQTHRILNDLVEDGYVIRTRVGRRNRYEIDSSKPMRHATASDQPVGALILALAS
jgi:DNA-binding IclR family transcriptional regulator